MGPKISVDSATMMNKGLEFIEACWLFDIAPSQIQVVLHPQSVVHSMVEYVDGSVIAQMGQPDMRTPIAYGLAWPERIDAGVERINWKTLKDLSFDEPDYLRFPCLKLAIDGMVEGGAMPAVINAANEVAVEAFLNRRLDYTEIAPLIDRVINKSVWKEPCSIEDVKATDQQAREYAREWVTP